jgi:hypothetical protein
LQLGDLSFYIGFCHVILVSTLLGFETETNYNDNRPPSAIFTRTLAVQYGSLIAVNRSPVSNGDRRRFMFNLTYTADGIESSRCPNSKRVADLP